MIYYKIDISLDERIEKEDCAIGTKLNQSLESLRYKSMPVFAYIAEMDEKKAVIVFAKRAEDTMELCKREILKKVKDGLSISAEIRHVQEITIEEFRSGISDSSNRGFVRNYRDITAKLKIDFNYNRCFEVRESIEIEKPLSKAEALQKAEVLMTGEEYKKEIERIYSEQNQKDFYVHPVHYHIAGGNEKSVQAMTELLIQTLIQNKRVIGKRISYIKGITQHCYDEQDFENLISNSQGATVVLSLNIEKKKNMNIAEDYDEVLLFIEKLVSRYQQKVLFIFQEVINENTIGKNVLANLQECVRMIPLEEGIGKKEQAEYLLKDMILKSEYAKFLDAKVPLEIPQQDSYLLSEIYSYFDTWREKIVYEKIYPSYRLKKKVVVEKKEIESSAYEELSQMIGLDEVKALIKQIIAMHRIQKKRQEIGMEVKKGALHSVFTGNPGSAKTTVARLLTRILYEEGIIQNKKIIECGRGDLVGKYVGWTAKLVKRKFREAANGVLFIDEAYALVDDRDGSYGDEAINTIVQEMENHREDVIVIFAGYPEKMKRFLEKNEGLRSRIAFYVDFPNYNKQELSEILKYMIKKNGFVNEDTVFEKCNPIFEQVCMNEEFGNGRYVRNLLEHAIMKQSQRLMEEYANKEIDEKELNFLKTEDFEELEGIDTTKKQVIGFQVV